MEDIEKLLANQNKPKTSHVLHLILSIITAGVWLPVWILIALINQQRCANIDRKIKRAIRKEKKAK
jgi:hypothetical protein